MTISIQVVNDVHQCGFEAHVQTTITFINDKHLSIDFHYKKSTRTLSVVKRGDCSICCNKRPGVQTRMFMVEIRACSSYRVREEVYKNTEKSFPPIIKPAEKPWYLPTVLNTSKIYKSKDSHKKMYL